jgi:hypothetical protein
MFFEHRLTIKKPLTGNSCKLIFEKLEQLRNQGHDPNECLKNSVMNGWQGVFPPAQQRNTHQKTSDADFVNLHTDRTWADGW